MQQRTIMNRTMKTPEQLKVFKVLRDCDTVFPTCWDCLQPLVSRSVVPNDCLALS